MLTPHHHSPISARIPGVAVTALSLAIGCVSPDDPTETLDAEERGEPPSPGAAGVGDALYPTLGNGGYVVEHYDLELRYATAAPTQQLDGSVAILARATQALSSFDLDFHGDGFGAVTVDGRPAQTSWDGDELVITPAHPIRRGAWFVVRVAHFTSTPVVPDPNVFLGAPFFAAPDNSAWAGQSAFAHYIFPSNDHPSNKASFSFRIDVPAGTTAVANGVLVDRYSASPCGDAGHLGEAEACDQRTARGRTIWRYEQCEPMATELAQVAVGALTVIDRGTAAGVHVRDVVPTRLAPDLADKLAIETEQIAVLEGLLGDYPFRTYGTLVVDTQLGFALETQTLSLFENSFFTQPEEFYSPIMAHELAHQWFGDSVAPAVWSDVWLNEGHATWYERTWNVDPDSPEFVELVHGGYAFADQLRFFYGPPGAPRSGAPQDVFNPNVYFGGAITLFALRQQVGDATFKAIEREWVTRYRGRSASTQDFFNLASEISGQDLQAFLTAWIYGDTTPAMPGHPDWTTDPVPTGIAARTIAPPSLPKFSVMIGTKH